MASAQALLWESAYCSFQPLPAPLVEWALAPYRVFPSTLVELKPDFVITQVQIGGIASLPEVEAAVQALCLSKVRVLHLNPQCLNDLWRDISLIACEIGFRRKGQKLIDALKKRVDLVRGMAMGRPRKRVLCLKWSNPLVAAESWVSELVQLAGGMDVGCLQIMLSWEIIRKLDPEILIFANTGWDLNRTYQEVARIATDGCFEPWTLSQTLHVVVADGSCIFSRPGPHLVESLEALIEILHPESQPFGHSGSLWRTLNFRAYSKKDDDCSK